MLNHLSYYTLPQIQSWQLIYECTFSGINDYILRHASHNAIHFGGTLFHLLTNISNADPNSGLVFLDKVDLSNAYI